ncbi:phosphoenolpyruvate carboxylase [Marinicella sp. S1101]|uniref:phosphoenolpyruvate carboxylase n=1 Tax=Marinicella marina TaxID=2996016 RepID=UPI0022608805|nr:phosphoenolpyruvate carboxylase [Marinicella marina]MCX7553377.1 phosphoenolpyruvate carboxylase [Marinicella marina]MDJ1139109.1 phosphoenolpyruvate carboxylase [Marinicella marina]
MQHKNQLAKYRNSVLNKFQIYNGLFLNLPFDAVTHTGMLLPLLSKACVQGFEKNLSPQQILTAFIEQHIQITHEDELISVLFRFIQYIERQIVLYDSVEESAFTENHDLNGQGSVPFLAKQADYQDKKPELKKALETYAVRVVLTAHPTQFYPGPVLGIMTDLSDSIAKNDTAFVEQLLQQLGKTPLFNKQKPTPFDEALSLIWYLENVFYTTTKTILKRIKDHVFNGDSLPDNTLIELGFWPGGDRDGNPFVNTQTTLDVAARLRSSILKCYHQDVRDLKRRLTFPGIDLLLEAVEHKLYDAAFLNRQSDTFNQQSLIADLEAIRQQVLDKHQGLFVDAIEALIQQVKTFGFYFAGLDVRQDSRIHHQVMQDVATETQALSANYHQLAVNEQISALKNINLAIEFESLDSALAKDTLSCVKEIQTIQQLNGEAGANRYIISNCQSALNVHEVLAFFTLAGWRKDQTKVDVVPLFETIDDLMAAPQVMQQLFEDETYHAHLQQRGMQQTIMLGFSDGTKDGGYLAANWAIVQAKEALSVIADAHDIKVIFFDGRGGPPARGGGETHKFYASQSNDIANHATQLTIQGQTISANFGNQDSAQYNLEQLLSAGLSSHIKDHNQGWDDDSKALLQELADVSLTHYTAFKQHPKFVPYLEKISTLKYYGQTNVGSRPTKRSKGEGLVFEDLRAIPFVGAWSQLKQNVLGYYGMGEALNKMLAAGRLAELQKLYAHSGYFKALVDNSMMSICKSFMPLTAYLQEDEEFGAFWLQIFQEFTSTESGIKKVAQVETLLADSPVRKQSIQTRESIVLPLLTIQQFSLQKINQLQASGGDEDLIKVYEKLVIRSLYGNINASRNSV